MFDIAALALAIFLLLQLQRVRALLSFVFGPLRARRIGVPRIPEATADLHAQAAAELLALGFEEAAWFLIDSPDGGTVAQPVAAWRHREHGDVLWLFAPPAPNFANRLLSVFLRRLADGRYCMSEAFDCYAEIGANEQVLARTIGGADFAAQWQQHRDWCARQGETDPAGTDDAAIDWQAGALHEQRLASLQQRGKVYRDSKGLLRPRLGFAWQMYTALWRQPKVPANTRPIPPAQLAWLLQVAERQTRRPVPRRVQAGLFAFSVALFLLLGGWFWGLRFAAILFVVVAIHELGHYLAMRLSGYRNVQMLALPLVGGVTIGHEATPDAARRAWMSLMGPLPGIVIGWALAIYVLMSGTLGGLAYEAALVFLFVNYLNVLPVPPLDGAHVVQELLPVGSARLSAVFVAIASLAGAALAFWLGFTLLAVIALLQLFVVRNRWQLGGVLRVLRNDPQMDKALPAGARQRRVFEVFDQVAGPTPQAPVRLALGTEALRSLDVKPMRVLQRVLVGGTYLLLLAGPIAIAAISLDLWRSSATQQGDAAAVAERYERDLARLNAQAAALDMRELLQQVSARDSGEAPVALAAAADDAAFAAAQEKLGRPLPADLAAFYRAADGAASLGLEPLARVQLASAAADLDLASFAHEGSVAFLRGGKTPDYLSLTPAELRNFLLLGHDNEIGTVALYDIAEPPLHAGLRFYWLDGDGDNQAQPDLQAWLRERWSGYELMVQHQQRNAAAQEREFAAITGWTPLQLLDAVERPAWWLRLMNAGLAWPGAAGDASIAAIATRFGAPLPDDLAEVYRQHDGMPVLQMLPLDRWQAVATLAPDVAAALRARYVALRTGAAADDVDACIAIAGYHDDARLRTASLLWCPRHAPAQRYLDLVHGRDGPAYVDLLRFHVAQLRASRSGLSGS